MGSAVYVGDREGCLAQLRGRDTDYVYVLRRPDMRPFYVGKGKGDRVFQHENEARHPNHRRSNSHKLNVIRSIWRSGGQLIYEIDSLHPDAKAAFARETLLIQTLGRMHEGGPLTNRAAGGGSLAGPSPYSLARHSRTLAGTPEDDPETATLNSFVLSIGAMDSVALKPRARFHLRPTRPYPRKRVGRTARQAIALAAAASANGLVIEDGTIIPRTVVIDDVEGFIENGLSCDLVTSGMATLLPAEDPALERFHLDAEQAATVVAFVGRTMAGDLGILPGISTGTEE